MPTPYSQSRTRGFSPWFQGPQSNQHIRVSDAERQAVTDRLAEHFADGRLDQAEFDERVGRATSAKTRADLNGLFDDLPETGAPAGTDRPRRRYRHPVLLGDPAAAQHGALTGISDPGPVFAVAGT